MPAENPIPEWARRERSGDFAWIQDNLHVFWPLAKTTFAQNGRGAIVVDTTVQPPDATGHPFGYVLQTSIEQGEDEDTQRLVREYDPRQEFVIKLLKPENRTSTYRVQPLLRDTNRGRTS